MYSVSLNINENIYDKVMFFLNNISQKDIEIKELKRLEIKHDDSLVDFFRSSPIVGEIDLNRNEEVYSQRLKF